MAGQDDIDKRFSRAIESTLPGPINSVGNNGDDQVQKTNIHIPDKKRISASANRIIDSQQPCRVFDTNNLPPVLSRHVDALCNETEADPMNLLQSVLCSISAIMRKYYCIPEGEYFQRLYPNVWMLTIADSGGFKTTSLNKGSAACFEIRKMFQKQIHAIKEKGNNLGEDDEKRIAELEKLIPILPNRVTAEGLLELLSQGCGGEILCSEFGEWLENISKSFAGALKATLTDFFDVPLFYDYKTRTQNHLKVEEPFISINAVSTLAWVIRNLQHDDVSSGFFARFLLFLLPLKTVIPAALPKIKQKAPAINEFNDQLKDMAAIFTGYQQPVEYRLPGETRKLFEAYHLGLYDALYAESDKAQEILGPYVKRWSPYILKIAMLLECVDDPDSNIIRPQMLEYSKGIVDYAIKSTTHLFKSELGETEQQRKTRKTLEYIARQGGVINWGKLLQSRVLDGGAKEYENVCQTLEESGQIVFDRPQGPKANHKLMLNTEFEKLEKT